MIKKILRRIKRILIATLGTKTDEIFWRFRHIFDSGWAKEYISEDSMKSPSRQLWVEKMSRYFPFKTVLEFGCASGPNLYRLAKEFPKAKFYGVDISRKAISEGKKFFEKENVKNVFLKAGSIESLRDFSDKSIDLVFTDALLIYLGTDKIKNVLKEILRIAKKGVIFFELHHNKPASVYQDNWIHNYKLLLEDFGLSQKIKITKLPKNIWHSGGWAEYGHIIEVLL